MAAAAPPVVALGVFGTGLIGSALMRQLAQQTKHLYESLRVDVRVIAVSRSNRMLLSPHALQNTEWFTALAQQGVPADPDALAAHVAAHPGASAGVVLDCTASDELPARYADWLGGLGLHIITPNKKLGAGPLQRQQELVRMAAATGRRFLYEATVGAGLPVLSTLRSLLDSGDRVHRIEGVLSGTLSYIFNEWSPGRRFSDVVCAAAAAGYTEPDPRDDLSGTDVARKVIILARECGLPLSMEALAVDGLVPDELAVLPTAADYLKALPQHDDAMAQRVEAAAAGGAVLRYVGTVDVQAGTASVRVAAFAPGHPLAGLRGSDNLIAFTTARYPESTPLVVRGPGAGAEVTAGGVFADLLDVLRSVAGPFRPK